MRWLIVYSDIHINFLTTIHEHSHSAISHYLIGTHQVWPAPAARCC
jgi:hypothetical protein